MNRRVIVFVTHGSFGDVNPLLAIAQRLAATHAVRFISNETYRRHVESAGVTFYAAGTEQEQQACIETTALSGRSMDGLMNQFRQHVGHNIARIAQYVERWYRNGDSLLVVTHGTVNPAFPICEKLGIPVVRAYYAPSHVPLHREDFVLDQTFSGCPEWRARWMRYPLHAARIRCKGPQHARHEYNGFRAAAGIGPSHPPYRRAAYRSMGRPALELNVAAHMLLTPRWFAEPIGSDAQHIHCVGFPFLDASHDDTTSRDAERRIDEFISRYGAPLVFTPGTGVEDMDDFCRPMESACRKLRVPGILLARHGAATFQRMQRVLNHPILHVEYAALSRLLPKAKLLVHTGGIGTIAEAIRAGVPQIIQPLFNDQPRNALRVLLNGLGGMLQGEGFTSTGIAELYRDLADNELHRDCLGHYSAAVRAEDGAGNAARLLETLSHELSDPRGLSPTVPLHSIAEATTSSGP